MPFATGRLRKEQAAAGLRARATGTAKPSMAVSCKATCWGDPGSGGDCSALTFTGKEQVFSTDAAFMSLEVEDLATVIPHALRSYLEHAHVDAHVLGRAWIGNL